MWLHRLRFMVRALTLVLAVAALMSGAIALARRSDLYRQQARLHSRAAADLRAEQRSKAWTARLHREQAEMWRRRARDTEYKDKVRLAKAMLATAEELAPIIAEYEAAARAAGARADHHDLLAGEYQRAADRPWLLFVSDPPEPAPSYVECSGPNF